MTSKKINLDGSHRQLIDLNGDAVNFNLEFSITPSEADKDTPYEIAITTQDKLDANADIKFAKLKGSFRKNLVNTSNNYQNFCLMINSDKKMTDMQINIELQDLGVPEEKVQEQEQPVYQENPVQTNTTKPPPEKEVESKKMKYILGGIIIIAGACILYYFWTQSKKKVDSVESATATTSAPSSPAIQEVNLPKSAPVEIPTKPAFSFY